MANNRIFYACQAIAIAPCFDAHTPSNVRIVKGAQSVGVTTNFNLEQAFELGQIQIYENIEGLPDIEVTLEKVLDGYPLIYHLSSPKAKSANLVGRSKERCCVALGIFADEFDTVSGTAPVEVYMSGMYLSSVSYTMPTDGNSTESVTLVGNHKEWLAPASKMLNNLSNSLFSEFNKNNITINSVIFNNDFPAASISGSGGIQRRENVDMANCIIPRSIIRSLNGASLSGLTATTGNNWDASTNSPRAHIQNCTISTDFGREDILELGRKAPYYRAPNFPVEVTCEFEVISVSGDFVQALESGDTNFNGTVSAGNNTYEETIKIKLTDGTIFDLGTKNRLSSVSFGGGDAGGGNATSTFSYSTFNDLIVAHNLDPAKSTIIGAYPT